MSNESLSQVLVSPQWLLEHIGDPSIRIVEIDLDPQQYKAGHIPGAIGLDWAKDLQDPVRRDVPSADALAALLGGRGVSADHTIVLYGDSSNWFAAYGFWLLKYYGHRDVRLLDGGRSKWLGDNSLPFTAEATRLQPVHYAIGTPDPSVRAFVADALAASTHAAQRDGLAQLVDVRSPDEFSGKVIAPPGMTETAQRGGHIPGATSVPWASAVNQDGTFKSASELRDLYVEAKGLRADVPTLAYCRIGERSSHTWFVLKYLLGFENVRNYDGSWTEYGSMIGVPVARG
ncbi:MAG: sulfurtransferase [Phycisphaerales bacterium]